MVDAEPDADSDVLFWLAIVQIVQMDPIGDPGSEWIWQCDWTV